MSKINEKICFVCGDKDVKYKFKLIDYSKDLKMMITKRAYSCDTCFEYSKIILQKYNNTFLENLTKNEQKK